MFWNRSVRFLVVIATVIIALIIIIILLLTHHAARIPVSKPMAAYASNPTARVAMLIDGPVNASSQHNQVLILVTNNHATIDVFRGYNDTLIRTKTYPFSEAGFHVFLRSLEFAKYNSGSTNSSLSQASGYCPTGDRYIFTFNVNGRQVQRYWKTSCPGLPHTFDGNTALTLQLFQSMIPDYSKITANINI